MSISIMSYCWRVPCATNSCKLVLMKLADHASDDGVCWPSWGHLVRHTGLSRATIARALSDLETAGYISRTSRSGTSTMYNIHTEAIKKATPFEIRSMNGKGYQGETPIDPSQDETTPSQDETPTRLKVTPPPSHGETVIIIEPPVEPKYKPEKSDIEMRKEELRMLYAEWVKHSGSETDKKAFKKHLDPVVDKYGQSFVSTAIGEYFRLLDDRRFMSVRRFAETAPAYMKKKVMRGIDPHSDMPPDEQLKHQ